MFLESHTISWMPKTFSVRLAFSAETGINLDLEQSLKLALIGKANIAHWGPFHIQDELYERAMKQLEFLNSGKILYKAIDTGFRPHKASNCIHAVADIDKDNGKLITGITYGHSASKRVAHHLKRWMLSPEKTHSWILKPMGLENYPLSHKAL